MSLMITRTLITIAAFVSVAILAAPRKKSNTDKGQRTEKWAIIGREYVEFDEDELKWRAGK